MPVFKEVFAAHSRDIVSLIRAAGEFLKDLEEVLERAEKELDSETTGSTDETDEEQLGTPEPGNEKEETPVGTAETE